MQVLLSIIILILVLGVIIFVHELGHFAVAKWFGIRVDEFGMGFPPRAVKLFSHKGTDYTLNWIPFGGFVKIHGEDSLGIDDPDYNRSIMVKPWWQQIAVLIAGVTMNVLLAWIIFSGMLMSGAPTLASQTNRPDLLENPKLTVLDTAPNSPAFRAGLKSGDVITGAATSKSIIADPDATVFTDFIKSGTSAEPITLTVIRGETTETISVTPETGIIPNGVAIGVAVDVVGYRSFGFVESLREGFVTTLRVVQGTAQAFAGLFAGQVSLDSVSGPVGLTRVVGEAQQVGITSLLLLTAVISVNLALINIMPFPALDGGRILFVIIETIIRRPLPKKFVEWTNGIGFMLLIGLMIVITIKDVIKLF